jgi:hypothetical protein
VGSTEHRVGGDGGGGGAGVDGGGVDGGRTRRGGTREGSRSRDRSVDGGVVVVGNEQDAIIKEGQTERGKEDGMQMEGGGGDDGRGRRGDGAGK